MLGIPVLAAVSMLQSDNERRKERRGRRVLQAAAAMLLVTFAIVTIYAEQGSDILRGLTASI